MGHVSTNFIGPENMHEHAGVEITKEARTTPKRHSKRTRKQPTPIVDDEVRRSTRLHRIEGFHQIQLADTQR
jgi:hypothetical protein